MRSRNSPGSGSTGGWLGRRLFLGTAALALLLLALVSCGGDDGSEAGSFDEGSFGNEHGERDYRLYVPSSLDGRPAPLLVMLHGCGQDAEDFAAGTRMNAIAERDGFLVLYPEQDPSANRTGCWNWFEPSDQVRGSGEPSIIAGTTEEVAAEHGDDPRRIYVAGMSAGGAMSVILAAAYPDLYAAVGVHSGLEYAAASGTLSALASQRSGGPDPELQGRLAVESARPAEPRVVPAIVFHGEEDGVVDVVNGHQVLSQWAQTADYADDATDDDGFTDDPEDVLPGSVSGGYDYVRYVYEGPRGETIMEKWIIEGLGHAWSGGDDDGSFTDSGGPDASEEMVRFFREHPGG